MTDKNQSRVDFEKWLGSQPRYGEEYINDFAFRAYMARELELAALREEVERLQQRLEIAHYFDGDGNKIALPPAERGVFPDGITCRDETIRYLEEQLTRLKAERVALSEDDAVKAIIMEWQDGTGDYFHLGVNLRPLAIRTHNAVLSAQQ